MLIKMILLFLSAGTFLTAGFLSASGGKEVFLIKLFLLLLVSFLSLTGFFLRSKKLREFLERDTVKKAVLIFLPVAFLFHSALGFALHMEDGPYAIWTTIDSVSYYIQAKIFSTGQLSVPSHELRDFFTTGFFINDGNYYSKYFPGWPLLLSLGVKAGQPWIINPALGLFSILFMYLIGREIYDKDTAIFAAALFLTSHTFFVLNPAYFSGPSALFFASAFFYCMIRNLKEPAPAASVLAGISLAALFLIRPFSAVAVSLPVSIYFIYTTVLRREKYVISFILFCLSFLPGVLALLAYNHLQTGDMFLTPFEYYNPADKLGFGLRTFDIVQEPYPYTPLHAVINTAINAALLNLEGVLFFFLFLAVVLINRKSRWDLLLITTLLSIAFFHSFYFARNIRYYYPAFFALCLLSARGINLSPLSLKKYFPGLKTNGMNYLFLIFVLIANIFVIISPMKFVYNYRSSRMMSDPFSVVEKSGINNAVVFVRKVPRRDNYTRIYIQNPLDYKGSVLYAMDLKERNGELMKFYPDKEFYYYDFDPGAKTGRLTRIDKTEQNDKREQIEIQNTNRH